MSDLQRANLIQSGDSEAITSFVQEFYPSVFKLMRHLTRSREDAEDLTQEAILKAKNKIRSYKGNSSLKTWVHKIAFHEYTHWRRKQRFLFRVPSGESYSESRYRSVEDGEVLLAALQGIKAPLREAFLLHEVHELTLEEIAQVVGSPLGTIKSRIHHARKALQELLRETEGFETNETPIYES